jgi:hypothetical protein
MVVPVGRFQRLGAPADRWRDDRLDSRKRFGLRQAWEDEFALGRKRRVGLHGARAGLATRNCHDEQQKQRANMSCRFRHPRPRKTTSPLPESLTGAHPSNGDDVRCSGRNGHAGATRGRTDASDYFFPAPAAAGAAAPPAVFWKLYVPPNFLLNRSTRPAVSTNFCLPVKNGWQLLQMSTVSLACVLRVVNVFPQAQ